MPADVTLTELFDPDADPMGKPPCARGKAAAKPEDEASKNSVTVKATPMFRSKRQYPIPSLVGDDVRRL